MFKRHVIEKIGCFDEQLKTGADYDFSVRLARAGRIGYVNELLGYYLDEGKGSSTKPETLQPVERTVIEIRYGAFHKIDPSYVYPASLYDIDHLAYGKKMIPVADYFENYDDFISEKITNLRNQKRNRIEALFGILKGWKK
jgi:GT2 family glycosyltransferase